MSTPNMQTLFFLAQSGQEVQIHSSKDHAILVMQVILGALFMTPEPFKSSLVEEN